MNSNHPRSIKKNIPEAVNKRLSALSSSEEMFKSVSPIFQEALKNAGYNYELKFKPGGTCQNQKKSHTHKRNILYFNPPFSQGVKTNVGAKFLKLIGKHFPKNNPLSKIINRNTVKMSYRCTPNMSQIISTHNSKILKKEELSEKRKCNCSKNNVCPLGGECLEENVIYQAKVTQINDPSKTETYVGLCATTFKDRYRNHKSSFKHRKNSTETMLSRHIWDLKDQNIDYELTWKILDRGKPFSPVSQICNLCTKEKYFILFEPNQATLNKKEELYNYCLHKSSQLLEKT